MCSNTRFPIISVAGCLNIINAIMQLVTFALILLWARGRIDLETLFVEFSLLKGAMALMGFLAFLWFIIGSTYVFG